MYDIKIDQMKMSYISIEPELKTGKVACPLGAPALLILNWWKFDAVGHATGCVVLPEFLNNFFSFKERNYKYKCRFLIIVLGILLNVFWGWSKLFRLKKKKN